MPCIQYTKQEGYLAEEAHELGNMASFIVARPDGWWLVHIRVSGVGPMFALPSTVN